MLVDHVYEAPSANMKMERQRWPEMPLILGRSVSQYAAMVTKLLSSNCGEHLVESLQKIKPFWYKLAEIFFSSYLIKIRLSVWRYYLANLHLFKTSSLELKEIFEIVNSICLLMEATCLCFKMGFDRKDATFAILALKILYLRWLDWIF